MRGPTVCGQCKEPIDAGEQTADVEVGGEGQIWHKACADEEAERQAGLEHERRLGVHKGEDDMSGKSTFDTFEGEDGWYWREVAHNGEELARSSEAYSSKEHAERGMETAIELAAEEAAKGETPDDAKGEVPENE